MWVRMTYSKFKPDKIDDLRKGFYEKLVPVVKKQKGNVDVYLMEPVDGDGDFISLNSWESKADMDAWVAYSTSGVLDEMINEAKEGFAGPPTVKIYEVKK